MKQIRSKTNMDTMHHGRKMIWFFIVVGALAVFTISIVAYVSSRERAAMLSNNAPGNTQANAPIKTTVTEVDPSTAPDLLPKDLPMEAGATIVKNYNTTTSDGRKLGTRVYVTAKSIDDNYKIFQTYFEQGGWTVTAAPTPKGSTSKTLIATKGNMQAQVTIGDDPVAKARTVAIIFTELPAN
jgi:hypothetical protein